MIYHGPELRFSLQLLLATAEKPLLPALEDLIDQVSEIHLSLQDFVRNGYKTENHQI
jgi:hypothetical protein